MSPPPPRDAADAEADLDFVGLAAFRDPLRAGVGDAVAELAHAGVRTIVVSGDHPETVAAAAREAGVHATEVMHGGAPLDALDDDELARRLRGEAVIARATPEDKLRLVRILQERDEAVAVTGDGVNDAPALAARERRHRYGRARHRPRPRGGRPRARRRRLPDDRRAPSRAVARSPRSCGAPSRSTSAPRSGLVVVIAVPLRAGHARPVPPGPHRHPRAVHGRRRVDRLRLRAARRRARWTARPRDPARRFLDDTQLSAIGLTAVGPHRRGAPDVPHRRAPRWGTDMAIAAAVGGWLTANAAVAWCLRAQPGLLVAEQHRLPRLGAGRPRQRSSALPHRGRGHTGRGPAHRRKRRSSRSRGGGSRDRCCRHGTRRTVALPPSLSRAARTL